MSAERLDCIVSAVCVKKRDPRVIDIKLLAAVLFNLSPMGDFDKGQLLWRCNEPGYKLVIRQQHIIQYMSPPHLNITPNAILM